MLQFLLKVLRGAAITDFEQITPAHLPKIVQNGLTSKIFLTPKIQRIAYSRELGKYLKYLRRKDFIDEKKDLRNLAENILL